jgi:hypothetical protein
MSGKLIEKCANNEKYIMRQLDKQWKRKHFWEDARRKRERQRN